MSDDADDQRPPPDGADVPTATHQIGASGAAESAANVKSTASQFASSPEAASLFGSGLERVASDLTSEAVKAASSLKTTMSAASQMGMEAASSLQSLQRAVMVAMGEGSKESWRDWTPDGYPEPDDDELITREQLIDELNRANVKMTARNLRHWEALGILPGPIRRHHEGATRALYAPWVVRLATIAAAAKTFGSSPEKLGREMRETARTVIVQVALRKQAATDERIRDAVKALADRYEEYLGERPALVSMSFRRDDGAHLYDFEIPTPE